VSRRSAPRPPFPDLVRAPQAAFGWLPASLLHEGWLSRLGPDASTVLLLLALAADRRGASYYSRARMAERLRLTRARLDTALTALLRLGLVAHRPWRTGHADGVWQLLSLPEPSKPAAKAGHPARVADLLSQLRRSAK